jgi:hypothetical protein
MPMMTRRHLLSVAGILLAGAAGAGVALVRPLDDPAKPVVPQPPTGLTDAIARSQALVGAYADAAVRVPALAPRLTVIAADHRAHLTTLQAELARYPQTASSTSKSTSTSTSSASPTPVGPTDAAATLVALRALETSAATANAQACLAGAGALAVLFGSISACENAHLDLLA